MCFIYNVLVHGLVNLRGVVQHVIKLIPFRLLMMTLNNKIGIKTETVIQKIQLLDSKDLLGQLGCAHYLQLLKT